jgi:hypothetical protein
MKPPMTRSKTMGLPNDNLFAAVRGAVFENNVYEGGKTHLSAQRRILEDGDEAWAVFIADFFHSDMTHITNNLGRDCPSGTVNEIAKLIDGCWEPEKDEVADGFGGYAMRMAGEIAAA